MLKFNKAWRFTSPGSIPEGVLGEFYGLIGKVAAQGGRRRILEHFKTYFAESLGETNYGSSDVGWADTDLQSYMDRAAENAPLFIEAFVEACRHFETSDSEISVPDISMINKILADHETGYQICLPELISAHLSKPISVPEEEVSLDVRAREIIRRSLEESERLLSERRSRQAVQEVLWLLETISTVFKGIDIGDGTVGGKYFNSIIKDLRRYGKRKNIEEILRWITTLHGYLSSPTGGGIRHGTDLKSGPEIDNNEAELFCNLIRSYITFLLAEHQRLRSEQR